MDKTDRCEMKKSLIIISLLVSDIFAEDYAGLSGSFMRLGITARSIAMGGAFTAEKDHGFSTFYNPAWAAFLIDRQVGLSYSSMSLDRRLSGLSFATPLPPTAGLGIAWVSACLLYTSPSPRDWTISRMPSSA